MTRPNQDASNPHRQIKARDARDQFLLQLLYKLWERYRSRVSHVVTYQRLVEESGATFINDHIAFRTFACQQPLTGIVSLSRIFEALGYRAAGCYHFPDKHLSAVHLQHPQPRFPKIFLSELKIWELSKSAEEIIRRNLQSHREPIPDGVVRRLSSLAGTASEVPEKLVDDVAGQFHNLPWTIPQREDVLSLNDESQYAAWVLVHGYNVNHFTSLVNSHGVPLLNDIEKTADALQAAGVPMKAGIEGQPGSKLRQTATEAVVTAVDVRDGEQTTTIPWTYAYFEFAERGFVRDSQSGELTRFEGFLGPQATNLFEMTKRT